MYFVFSKTVATVHKANSVVYLSFFSDFFFRDREGNGEKDLERFVIPLIYASLVDFCMCPDWGSDPQP